MAFFNGGVGKWRVGGAVPVRSRQHFAILAVCQFFRVVVQFEIPESRMATLGRLLSGRSARLTTNCITTFFRGCLIVVVQTLIITPSGFLYVC